MRVGQEDQEQSFVLGEGCRTEINPISADCYDRGHHLHCVNIVFIPPYMRGYRTLYCNTEQLMPVFSQRRETFNVTLI